MWTDNRPTSNNEDVTPTKMYEMDREWLRELFPNPRLTWADRVRRLRHQVEASGNQHPYAPELFEMASRMREAGHSEEERMAELLAGLWGRMAATPEHRDVLAQAGVSGLRDAVGLDLAQDDEDAGEDAGRDVEIRPNPSADTEVDP